MGDGERAVGARALGVDDALRDALAVEVRELLDQVEILEQQTGRAGRRSEFWLSATGAPLAVVSVLIWLMRSSSSVSLETAG